jgi:hypothetical protein
MTIDAFRDPRMTVIYGLGTCEDTTRARERFDAAGRAYRYVGLDLEPAIAQRLHDLGHVATPVVVPPTGKVMVEPSDEQLAEIIAATA